MENNLKNQKCTQRRAMVIARSEKQILLADEVERLFIYNKFRTRILKSNNLRFVQ